MDSIHTLLLYANGVGWKKILADTVLRGVLHDRRSWDELPGYLKRVPATKLLYGQRYETLSYLKDWQEAFLDHPQVRAEACNINNLVHYYACLRRIGQYDLVVVLHSATGDDLSLLLKTSRFYTARRGKLLVLVGNEYNHLALKRRFINETQADYIGSQLPLPAAQWLYADCAASAVVEAPHALNPKEYHPLPAVAREFDIGFVGDIYSYAIGDIERTRIIEFFRDRGREFQLNCRIQNQRMPASQWNLFLNRCQGIIGAESGTYYLEKDDRTMTAVREYLLRHPDATFAEVYERFYRNYPCPVNGKAISSRHFEPIGTKTCQILLAGEYNGILQPERHYIAVRKDLADIADAIERFKDENYRRRIVEQSYEDVLNHHTYRHRIDSILDRIFNGSGDVYR